MFYPFILRPEGRKHRDAQRSMHTTHCGASRTEATSMHDVHVAALFQPAAQIGSIVRRMYVTTIFNQLREEAHGH